MRGNIKYINTKERYGYIKVKEEKDVLFRMQEGDELLKAQYGTEVTFDLVDTGTSRYAVNISILQENTAKENVKNLAKENTKGDEKESCQIASEIISKCTGKKETLFPFLDLSKLYFNYEQLPENAWLVGRPDFYWKQEDRLIQGIIRKQKRYLGTNYGGPIENPDLAEEQNCDLVAPRYGCSSFLLGKRLYENCKAYCEKAGLNPEFYYFVFVEGEKLVSMISLAHVENLVRGGYNQYKKLGEYPSKIPSMPPRYMIPVTHCQGYKIQKEKKDEK